jgi:hypothetical protein
MNSPLKKGSYNRGSRIVGYPETEPYMGNQCSGNHRPPRNTAVKRE